MIEGQFNTEIGKLRYAITDGKHVHIGTSGRDDPVVLRNIGYNVSFHLYLQPDGSWKINEKYVDRIDRWNFRTEKFASDSAIKKIIGIVESAWYSHCQDANSHALLVSAERDSIASKISRVAEDIIDLNKKVKEKEQELESLRNLLTNCVG